MISGHQQGRVDLGFQVWGQSIRRKKIQKKKNSNRHLYSTKKLLIKINTQNHYFLIHKNVIIYQQRQKKNVK